MMAELTLDDLLDGNFRRFPTDRQYESGILLGGLLPTIDIGDAFIDPVLRCFAEC